MSRRPARGIGRTLSSLGDLALREGDLDRAEQLLEQARVAQAEQDPQGAHMAWFLQGLAEARQQRGDFAGAERALRDALPILQGLRGKADLVWCLDRLAVIAAAQGQAERARRLAGAAEALRREEEDETALDAAVALGLEVVDA